MHTRALCFAAGLLFLVLGLKGCMPDGPLDDGPASAVVEPQPLFLPPEPQRIGFAPRVYFDSGWQQTDGPAPKKYRLRIYTSPASGKQALVVYGHLGGSDGARFPAVELADAPQQRSEFDDSDGLIDLRAGFAWVRFAPLPGPAGVIPPPPARSPRPTAWRLFSTYSLFVDPVGTEFVVATSTRSRFDLVCVTTPGAVEVSQRYIPGSPRITISLDQLVRRGGAGEPVFNIEDISAAGARRDMAADVLDIARLAIDRYNQLPAETRPTPRLNPPSSLPPVR